MKPFLLDVLIALALAASRGGIVATLDRGMLALGGVGEVELIS